MAKSSVAELRTGIQLVRQLKPAKPDLPWKVTVWKNGKAVTNYHTAWINMRPMKLSLFEDGQSYFISDAIVFNYLDSQLYIGMSDKIDKEEIKTEQLNTCVQTKP